MTRKEAMPAPDLFPGIYAHEPQTKTHTLEPVTIAKTKWSRRKTQNIAETWYRYKSQIHEKGSLRKTYVVLLLLDRVTQRNILRQTLVNYGGNN